MAKAENNGQGMTNGGRMKVNTGIRHAHPSATLHSERATRSGISEPEISKRHELEVNYWNKILEKPPSSLARSIAEMALKLAKDEKQDWDDHFKFNRHG